MELCSVTADLNRHLSNTEMTMDEEHDRKMLVARTKSEMVKHPEFFTDFLAEQFENDYANVIAAIYADPAEALHTLQKWVDELTQAKAEQMVLEGEAFDTLRVEEHEDHYISTLEECAPR